MPGAIISKAYCLRLDMLVCRTRLWIERKSVLEVKKDDTVREEGNILADIKLVHS